MRLESRSSFACHLARGLDWSAPLFHFDAKQTSVIFQKADVIAWLSRDQRVHERCDPAGIKLTVSETCSEHFAGEPTNFLIDLHQASWGAVSSCNRRWSSGVSTLSVTFAVVSITERPCSWLRCYIVWSLSF